MNETFIRELLNQVKNGSVSEDQAFAQLKELPYKDIGFANVDHHRAIRTGFPEVIYCQGKTREQIRDIFMELASKAAQDTEEKKESSNRKLPGIMGTRATERDFACVKEVLPEAVYHKIARIIEVPGATERSEAGAGAGLSVSDGSVAVVSAGTADIPIAEEVAVTAEVLGCGVMRVYDVGVAGIHRLFSKLDQIRQADVVIVVAGMEGALASVVGGLVDSPVIAVPTSIGYGSNFRGLSSLLSMLNSCANGVAVVNIDNGFGAAYMAAMINRKMVSKAER